MTEERASGDQDGTGPGGGAAATRAARAAAAAVTAVAVVTAEALAGDDPLLAGGVPYALGLAALVLAAGRWPRAALLASVQTVVAFRGAGLSDVGWIWPASAAYFLVAAGDPAVRGVARTRLAALVRRMPDGLVLAVAVGVGQVVFAANWELYVAGLTGRDVVAELGAETLWLALVLAAATAWRNGRNWRREEAAGRARAARERAAEARRRAEEERLRIARELHDVVAHTLTVVGVQLRVAVEALEDEPEEARAALKTAQEVRATAVADLRSLVGVLRGSGADPGAMELAPERGLDGVGDLVERVRAAGLDAAVETEGDPAGVPAPVALAVYRIVQESLTNAVRHSGGTRVEVRLRYGSEAVRVEIADDGPAGPGPRPGGTDGDRGEGPGGGGARGGEHGFSGHEGGGHGVAGMRERVSVLGGEFASGPGERGGYTVRAVIPVPS
ncbi:sensor histidine kinase [Streptomyces sp. NPDC056503]|uniref:sensor histidine kinase n=1 Tax=Streptomyces sp. NPDC056503 TaxID=3345842 RepID=UPI0036BB0EBC